MIRSEHFICLIATKANAATGLFCFGNYEKIDTFYSDIFKSIHKNLLKDVGTRYLSPYLLLCPQKSRQVEQTVN